MRNVYVCEVLASTIHLPSRINYFSDAEPLLDGNGHHLCASAVANRRSAHGASAPGLQMPPTIRLELALPRAEAAAARPEAPIARMWHLVREGRYLTALRIGLLWLVRLA